MKLRRQQMMGRNRDFVPRLMDATGSAFNRISPMRRRRAARRRNQLTGLGIALLAVPVGVWIARTFLLNDDEEFEQFEDLRLTGRANGGFRGGRLTGSYGFNRGRRFEFMNRF
ncbi:MAG: hypothetical protein LBG44_03870 [Gemmatimonadota bacterium]|jgi:hypothetical protein|nr:hypothetical protein [Gemmatimonadota bacterium]